MDGANQLKQEYHSMTPTYIHHLPHQKSNAPIKTYTSLFWLSLLYMKCTSQWSGYNHIGFLNSSNIEVIWLMTFIKLSMPIQGIELIHIILF